MARGGGRHGGESRGTETAPRQSAGSETGDENQEGSEENGIVGECSLGEMGEKKEEIGEEIPLSREAVRARTSTL